MNVVIRHICDLILKVTSIGPSESENLLKFIKPLFEYERLLLQLKEEVEFDDISTAEYIKHWNRLQAIKYILKTKKPEVHKLVEIISEKSLSYVEVDSFLKELLGESTECKNILDEVKEKISIKGL